MRPTRFFFTIAAALCSWTAHACTVCDSRNGQQLRAGLFDGHFMHTLLLIAAPAPVLVATVLLLHLAMPDLPEDSGEPATKLASPHELPASEVLA
jgi:hypothetical protein